MTTLNLVKPDNFFCSDEARSRQENLLGSAPRADVWFMLEYNGRWGSQAFAESDIAAEVKDKVNAQLARIPRSRLLLIKQSDSQDDHIAFFAAISVAEEPRLYHFTLSSYKQLLELDLEAIADGRDKYADAVVSEHLLLVCTNGLRDKCCARNGVPAYRDLSSQFGAPIWQSTHHGGHRYGANMLAMPHGLSYGQVDQDGGVQAVQAYLDEQVWLDNLRGRTIYDQVAQAAEGLLRRETGLLGVDDLQFAGEQMLEDSLTEVRFTEHRSDAVHEIILRTRTSEEMIFVSCEGDKQSPLVTYELVKHTEI